MPMVSSLTRVLVAGSFAVMAATTAAAQWKTPNKPGTPRTPIDANAPAPRTADGKPDLSGVWVPNGSDFSELASGAVPLTDEAERIRTARQTRSLRDFPKSHCLPMGIVNQHTAVGPVKFIQIPTELIVLVEENNERREIFTDGRSLPGRDAQPMWNGYSVGRWDGDTLVVTSTGFRDGQWLNATGIPLTDAAVITERFQRPSLGRMDVVITVDDRKTFLRPAVIRVQYRLAPDDELMESICAENNKFGPEPGTDKP